MDLAIIYSFWGPRYLPPRARLACELFKSDLCAAHAQLYALTPEVMSDHVILDGFPFVFGRTSSIIEYIIFFVENIHHWGDGLMV